VIIGARTGGLCDGAAISSGGADTLPGHRHLLRGV